MKTCLTIVMSLAFVTAAVRGQDLPTYQSTVAGQSPYYYNHLDNSLVPSVGVGTLVATATGTGFTNDYFGNASDAAYFTNTTGQLSLATGNNIIYNSGVANANSIGSMSLLFQTPNTNGNVSTRYIFSNGETSPSDFYLKLANDNILILAAGNISSITNSTSLTPGTWYYWAATWNFSGANSSAYGINYYLGVAGGNSLSSGFKQRGGTGNISSTAILGNGGIFDLSGQTTGSGGFQVAGVPGMADELATWNTQLSSSQILAQYNALITVPEPSTLVLCISALLGLSAVARRRRI